MDLHKIIMQMRPIDWVPVCIMVPCIIMLVIMTISGIRDAIRFNAIMKRHEERERLMYMEHFERKSCKDGAHGVECAQGENHET